VDGAEEMAEAALTEAVREEAIVEEGVGEG
jgi:hypothetical protein